MTEAYRYGLNRFIPSIFVGDALLIPSRTLPGKFDVVENSGRFASPAVVETTPIAHLVEPQQYLPWNAPTVMSESKSLFQSKLVKPLLVSDYKFLQRSAQRRSILPVLDYDTGWIYNLAPVLRAIDLLDYSRILAIAAQRSLPGYYHRNEDRFSEQQNVA